MAKQPTKEEKIAQYLDEQNQLMQMETANAMQGLGAIGQFVQLEVARSKLAFIMEIQKTVADIHAQGAGAAAKPSTE